MAEQRRLYKENGVSMYGGCLPLIVQMPFIYALYGAFLTVIHAAPLAFPKNVVALNNDMYSFVPHLTSFPQTHFLWANLVSPDPLHILPVLAAALTFIQLRMAMPVRKPRQPGENPDATMQATATTQYIMPFVTLFIGWTFPAGLALYWCISTGFSAVQQYFINGNWGSLFVGVPRMEHLVPPPKELAPTVTRTPAIAGAASARALTATTEAAPQEAGLRGWWQRMRENASAAQTQALERAEQTRKEREEARALAQEQAESMMEPAARTPRRQRGVSGHRARFRYCCGHHCPPVIAMRVATMSPRRSNRRPINVCRQNRRLRTDANGANGANGKTAAKPASGSNGSNGSNGAGGSNGSHGASGSNGARNGANGTRSTTTGSSNAARKNTAKGGSGARPRGGRPKGGR